MEIKMLSEKQILSKLDTSLATDRMLRKANLAILEMGGLNADNETAFPNFGLLDLEKKKEQFLTIDRF